MVSPALTITAGVTALLSGAALTVAIVLPTTPPADLTWFDQPAALSVIAPGDHEILMHTNVQGSILQFRVDVYDYDTGQIVEVLGSDGQLLERTQQSGRQGVLSSDSVIWPGAQPGGYVLIPAVRVAGEFTTTDRWIESPSTAIAVSVVEVPVPYSPIDPIPLPNSNPTPAPGPTAEPPPPAVAPTGDVYLLDPFDPRVRGVDVLAITPQPSSVLIEVQVRKQGVPTDEGSWIQLPCTIEPDGAGRYRCSSALFTPSDDACGSTYVGYARATITTSAGVLTPPQQTWIWSSRGCDG